MLLSGKVAVVTGGTGGLGSGVVPALLAEGASVALPYTRSGALDTLRQHSTVDAAVTQGGSELMGELVDLTDENAVAAFYQHVQKALGGIDILINIAGGFGGGQPVHETPWSLWQQQLDINLKTAVLSSHFAVPYLLERGGGAIVNVSTRAATESGAKFAAYAGSKRALLQLTEAMAVELRSQNITVNSVLPSIIDTPANRLAMPKANHDKWVKPEEIARVLLFLVGPDARIISGAQVPVYGRA